MSKVQLLERASIGGIIATCAFLIGAGAASAHVTIQESEIVGGEFSLVTISVPHGCDDSPTTEVRIQMPESIPAVTPTINANWDVEKVMETLAEPIQGEHGEITERVSEVVYTAKTPLPDGYRDAFELSLRAPTDVTGLIFFPTVQICETGETDWIEIPADGQDPFELESPAPFVNVVAGAGEGHSDAGEGDTHGDDADAAATGDTVATDGSVPAADGAAADVDDSDDDSASNGLAIAALVVGVLALGTGAVAIARTRTS